MIWDSAPKDEYPAIRNFALQKKLAIIAAHDSILAARVKQTRNANRKRQIAPFKEGDLVYLSTKNISFPTGLARKLVPKFIGPYKITRDFGNHSFKLELPNRMIQRGIHDVFHASLLRIHVPNDDRLFPGRLESQLGIDPDTRTESEWAVDKILGHTGTCTAATFQVQWKAGDVTWLPYDKIMDLTCLPEYLHLLGVDNVANLPAGHAQPPSGDPQIFLGSITSEHIPTTPIFPYRIYTSIHTLSQNPLKLPALRAFAHSPHYTLPMSSIIIPSGIDHPAFTRIDANQYLFRRPDAPTSSGTIITADTLKEFCDHARHIVKKLYPKGQHRQLASNTPVNYQEFAVAFNIFAPVLRGSAYGLSFPVWDENQHEYVRPLGPCISFSHFMCKTYPPHLQKPRPAEPAPAPVDPTPPAMATLAPGLSVELKAVAGLVTAAVNNTTRTLLKEGRGHAGSQARNFYRQRNFGRHHHKSKAAHFPANSLSSPSMGMMRATSLGAPSTSSWTPASPSMTIPSHSPLSFPAVPLGNFPAAPIGTFVGPANQDVDILMGSAPGAPAPDIQQGIQQGAELLQQWVDMNELEANLPTDDADEITNDPAADDDVTPADDDPADEQEESQQTGEEADESTE